MCSRASLVFFLPMVWRKSEVSLILHVTGYMRYAYRYNVYAHTILCACTVLLTSPGKLGIRSHSTCGSLTGNAAGVIHASYSCKTLIGVHEMHGRMHPN